MIRISGRSCVTHSSFGRSTCFILPDRGSFTVVVRFQTNFPVYFSSLRIREIVDTFQPPLSLAMESWFSTFKSELGERFDSYANAKEQAFDYIEVFYSHQRRHSSLGYVSRAQFERNGNRVRQLESAA
jgi:hypothetical protein